MEGVRDAVSTLTGVSTKKQADMVAHVYFEAHEWEGEKFELELERFLDLLRISVKRHPGQAPQFICSPARPFLRTRSVEGC